MRFSNELAVDIYETGAVILFKAHNFHMFNLFYIIDFDNIVL